MSTPYSNASSRFLEARLGERLQAVWLFGSRARGDIDRPDDSDIDILVIADDASWQSKLEIYAALDAAAHEPALARVAWSFSVHVQTPEWLRQRREILEAELRLAALRKHRKASQTTVAKRLSVSQSNLSQLERGADPRLSTVANYVDALGGKLELVAVFDDERILI
jgi:predicted nucleotidyltransferase